MKIKIPTSLDDITIEQFIIYNRILELGVKDEALTIGTISCFCGLNTEQVMQLPLSEIKTISETINSALTSEVVFVPKFKNYGFIPNLDKITAGEYIDIDKYIGDIENSHRLMAILFRPITKMILTDYLIEPYNGSSKYSDEMLKAPLSAYLGAKVFFWNLGNELLKATKASLQQPTTEVEILENHLVRSGVGMEALTRLLTVEESI